MSILLDINSALENRLSTLSSVPPIAWPNVSYEPDPTTLYLRPNNLPIDPVRIGMGDADPVVRGGIFQVDVFAPRNGGQGDALVQADAIRDHFATGLELLTATDSHKLRIGTVTIEVGVSVGSHFAIPVLINYSAVTN